MNRLLYRFFVLLLLSCFIEAKAQDYYWYKDKKYFLDINYKKRFVVFEEDNKKEDNESIIANLKNCSLKDLYYSNPVPNVNKIDPSFRYDNIAFGIVETEQFPKTVKGVIYDSPYYFDRNGNEIGVSNFFYIKLKQEEDFTLLQQMAKDNGVQIIGRNNYMPLWYTLMCTNSSKDNCLSLSAKFFESNLFEASEPDLIFEDLLLSSNDLYYNYQWNLNNTGQNTGSIGIDINFEQSSQVTLGDPRIIVAVLDQGIELNHPDFNNIYFDSYDTENGTSPSVVRGNHGTACAGIIGATSNNSIGISGIAPDCKLMSISNKFLPELGIKQKLANGINYAWMHGASVISNSWGHYSLESELLDDAISNAITNGRNGYGTIVVFASGNDNSPYVSYPANSTPEIIAVGAMSPCGTRKSLYSCDGENWGSNYGNELDVVAPGVLIPTTDRIGTDGYNPSNSPLGDYYMSFNGTSSACPHVAAIAALVLSQNSFLYHYQVASIIESTAQKVGGYNYSNYVSRPNGSWNSEVGYGLVDAYSAVLAANMFTTFFENQLVTDDQVITGYEIHLKEVFLHGNADLTVDSDLRTILYGKIVVPKGTRLTIK